MILSAQTIRKMKLVDPLREPYIDSQGNSAGLSACGYDLTLAQGVTVKPGQFILASTVERFNLPINVAAIIHDKSSLARRGLVVQNTIAEPGWHGYLTLELTNHGKAPITIFQKSAICQAVFHCLDAPTELPYKGRYQNQGRDPQESK